MNKIFHIGSTFKAFEENDDLMIAGMASTNDVDRVGDVIEASAWTVKGGLQNYLNNPVILFNHDYNQPIGRAVQLGTEDNGLQLKAKIAKSAGKVGDLIKEGVLGAFSVGFRVKDAEYMSESDGYKIKDAELLEVSVVSVPANQAATFSLAKSFNSEKEYEDFKNSFKNGFSVSSDEPMSKDLEQVEVQEKTMEIDIESLVASAVEKATAAMAMKDAERKAEEQKKVEAAQKAAEAEAAKKAETEQMIVTAATSGAERLMADVEKRFAEKDADVAKLIEDLKSDLAEKSEEIQKMRDSKRVFSDRSKGFDFDENREEILDAHMLGIITRKGFDTKLGRELMEKAVNTDSGTRVPSASVEAFETFVSTSIEKDIELELVLDPLFRKITMNAANMVIPTMPDAGYAEFNSAAGAGSGDAYNGNLATRGDAYGSPYGGVDLGSKTLTTKKLISRSYIANETEEDAIIPVLGLIRESMVRSHARSIEQSILLGNHSTGVWTANVYDGLCKMSDSDSKTKDLGSPASGPVTAAMLLDLRQSMGKYGRRPSDVVYIVSLEAYYDLLDDTEFDDLNLVGDRATKLTGEIGSVYGSGVIVCDEFNPTHGAATDGNFFAVAVNTRNFVVPVLRGVTVEQDYEVANQRRVLVASQRRGFDRIFSAAGQVAAYKY